VPGQAVPRISICIITGRRLPQLDACLASLQRQEAPPPFEVLVCSDGDHEVAELVHGRFPDARVCFVEQALPGAGRNLLVDVARGELLLFLDDDVTVEVDLLARLSLLADEHPEAGVFGGPNDSALDSTRFQFVQGAVLASIVGSGPVRRRYGAHPAGYADERFFVLCNLAVRRSVMVPFSHELVCAEENAVLAEMSARGVRMFYDPALVAYHERRPTIGGFVRQMHKYGYGRGQLLVRERRTFRPAFLAPTALLAYLAAAAPLTLAAGPVALLPLLAYGGAVTAEAAHIAATLRRPLDAPTAALLTVLLHGGYGVGLLRGVVARRREVEAPVVLHWHEAR
jgi:glycosyltransferase involved in cell wall biosynthesis